MSGNSLRALCGALLDLLLLGGCGQNEAGATLTLAGTAWHDLDGDARRTADEPTLANWTVFLDADDDGVLDPGERSVTTAVDGSYAFTGVAAGTNNVSQVLPLGWSNTLPAVSVGALEPQIVGGEDAAIGDSPWMAGIIYTNGTLSFGDEGGLEGAQGCGGSLIASRWVLSAAHCFFLGEVGTLTLSNGTELSFVSLVPPPLGTTTPDLVAVASGCAADDFTDDLARSAVVMPLFGRSDCAPFEQYLNAVAAGGVIFYDPFTDAAGTAARRGLAHNLRQSQPPFAILLSAEDGAALVGALETTPLTATFGTRSPPCSRSPKTSSCCSAKPTSTRPQRRHWENLSGCARSIFTPTTIRRSVKTRITLCSSSTSACCARASRCRARTTARSPPPGAPPPSPGGGAPSATAPTTRTSRPTRRRSCSASRCRSSPTPTATTRTLRSPKTRRVNRCRRVPNSSPRT